MRGRLDTAEDGKFRVITVTIMPTAVPMSGHSMEQRFAVMMEDRRRFTRAEKLTMVAEIGLGSVSAVARKHNIASSLLFRWRREFGSAAAAAGSRPAEAGFIPVALPAPVLPQESGLLRDGAIEIVLAGNRRAIVGKDFDSAALKRELSNAQLRHCDSFSFARLQERRALIPSLYDARF